MTDVPLREMLAELRKDCQSLLDHATEAQDHFKKGDLEAVQQVISLSEYKINQITMEREAILKHLAG